MWTYASSTPSYFYLEILDTRSFIRGPRVQPFASFSSVLNVSIFSQTTDTYINCTLLKLQWHDNASGFSPSEMVYPVTNVCGGLNLSSCPHGPFLKILSEGKAYISQPLQRLMYSRKKEELYRCSTSLTPESGYRIRSALFSSVLFCRRIRILKSWRPLIKL